MTRKQSKKRRLQGINMLKDGYDYAEVAEKLNVSLNAVSKWANWYDSNGNLKKKYVGYNSKYNVKRNKSDMLLNVISDAAREHNMLYHTDGSSEADSKTLAQIEDELRRKLDAVVTLRGSL